METTSLKLLNKLHPLIRDVAIKAYNEAVQATPSGTHPYITQTTRTFKESNDLYAKGRTSKGSIVTNAKAGQSYHNYGLALDFVNMVDGKMKWVIDDNWMIVVDIFKKHGFKWGGDFKSIPDAPHFEMTFGYNWRKLLEMYNNKDFIVGTNYVNICI